MNCKLEEEGYKVPENVEPTQLPIFEAQVIQTITLKELSEKTNTEELKDGENTAYPAEISAIVGKELTFTIQINDDNILLNSKIFTVIDAYDMIALTASTCLSASTSEATMHGFTATSISEVIV
ncbi:hypothetical protein POM88_045285 [Heracleum sosnowskyi]|uniref:Uncharacterized protein n=1 Tax=Heracleum sosnowskyi TaxID=360622 RepID=A0AAD8M4T4_9APIA|nr:hypothetical protein POM88_045285 [Heracleum sosnowskyi]